MICSFIYQMFFRFISSSLWRVDRLIVVDFGRLIAAGDPEPIMASREVREIYMGLDALA